MGRTMRPIHDSARHVPVDTEPVAAWPRRLARTQLRSPARRSPMTRCLLLVGTPKGAFILESDGDRRQWSIRGPLCDGWPVQDINVDRATNTLYAGAGSPWFGPAVFRSDDLGETWTHSSEGLTYGDAGPKVAKVWNVTQGLDGLYAGVDPAGLFRSTDGGASWQTRNKGTRAEFNPENRYPDFGQCVHKLVLAADGDERLYQQNHCG